MTLIDPPARLWTGSPRPQPPTQSAPAPLSTRPRPAVDGKFLTVRGQRFYAKGVTYGTFKPNSIGEPFPEIERVRDDFQMMRAAGINTVRLYTSPSDRIADAAADAGLMIVPDICWGSRTCELDYPEWRKIIYDYTRQHARRLAHHPAMLMMCIGNEIPPLLVRWYGRDKIEQHFRRLYDIVKSVNPDSLVTYANHPPAEHLNLGFLDVVSFNVYLDREKDFRKYLARLQTIAGERPLFLSEIGLDSSEHGEPAQAKFLAGHLRALFEKGLCGAAVYSWTDEWSIFNEKIEGWSFGLTTPDRKEKLAYDAVKSVYSTDFHAWRKTEWPRVSVVVCSYNGGKTLARCLRSLDRLTYPNYEVIVVDDGSRDLTRQIVKRYNCRGIHIPNGGLSRARNLGIDAATGEVVAFIDSDAYADPDWLFHMIKALEEQPDAGGVGGPNLSVPHAGFTAQCVDHAPGNPTHVLLSDETAEHVPGCNMAFRKTALERIGKFDPTHRAAGDDVDVCWKLLIHGYTIAFAPSGFVWHHRRPTVKAYLRQQKGYGFAEAFLQRRYPSRFNVFGDLVWHGSIYDGVHVGLRREGCPTLFKPKVYQGQFCNAQFQSVYQPFMTWWFQMFTAMEWQVTTACIGASAILTGIFNSALSGIILGILSLLMLTLTFAAAALAASHAGKIKKWKPHERTRAFALVAWLHIRQPLTRASGRIRGWWASRSSKQQFPVQRRLYGNLWSRQQWLEALQVHLKMAGWITAPSSEWSSADLDILGPGPCKLAITSVYEDDVAHSTHYIRYRITAKRKRGPHILAAALAVFTLAAVLYMPALLPAALPLILYVGMVARSKRRMTQSIAQMAIECGRPFGMTPALDDFNTESK